MMTIAHVSDSHGNHHFFPRIRQDALAIFHTGDFLPNNSRGNVKVELLFQEEWVRTNKESLQTWVGDRLFVFCAGNHDFFDPVPLMREWGIQAYNATNQKLNLLGKSIYGFPYIPYIAGEWNYEREIPEMSELVEEIPDVDILLAHCPPAGILDFEGGGKPCGNTSLANRLAYGEGLEPAYLLCGHFHGSSGIHLCEGGDKRMLVSNAATTTHHFTF